jgi:NAD(P)H-dependent flavin oxidoreductase YrpB (nitropropane dioxygenase family)
MVWMQVSSIAKAQDTAALGLDALIIQGGEAGGHNRASSGLITLLPSLDEYRKEEKSSWRK